MDGNSAAAGRARGSSSTPTAGDGATTTGAVRAGSVSGPGSISDTRLVATPGAGGPSRRVLGRRGEDAACGYLIDRGAQILDRNWRCRHGEVDIVARFGNHLVFCEVRTRRGRSCGTPLESITPAKVARMGRVAQAWLTRHGPHAGPVRLDVLGWLVDGDSRQLTHIEGVQP